MTVDNIARLQSWGAVSLKQNMQPRREQRQWVSDATRFFGRANTVYSPTFVVGGPGPRNDEYFLQESEVWKNEKLRLWMPWKQLVPPTRRPSPISSPKAATEPLGHTVNNTAWGHTGRSGSPPRRWAPWALLGTGY